MAALTFPLGVLCVFVGVGLASVFGFDYYEHAWGRWGSFQVMVWIGMAAALAATVSFAMSAVVLKRTAAAPFAFVLGVFVAIAGCAVLALGGRLQWHWSVGLAALCVLSAVAPLFCAKHGDSTTL